MIAPVSVRINPNVDAKTHAKISTGKAENKFGIPFERASEVYQTIAACDHLNAVGIDMHIGSQITDLEPFDNAFKLLAELVEKLSAEGHQIEHIDVGGGLGIPYDNSNQVPPEPMAYAQIVRKNLNHLDCEIVLEPGRMVAGNAGIFITKVEYVKEGAERQFVIVDAGMNDLLRPTLYESYHTVQSVKEDAKLQERIGDVVGPRLRNRGLYRQGPPSAACGRRRLARRDERRCLWRGDVRHLQHAAPLCRSDGGWRSVPRDPPPPIL